MGLIKFVNNMNITLYLHMREGVIGQDPDERGSRNATIPAGGPLTENVGDGDIWYAYGRQLVNDADNPQLCHADAGDVIQLDGSSPCFVP